MANSKDRVSTVDDPRETAYQKEQNAWQRELENIVAYAIGQSIVERKLLRRKCNDLELSDLIGIGIDACAAYEQAREARRIELGLLYKPDHPPPPWPIPL